MHADTPSSGLFLHLCARNAALPSAYFAVFLLALSSLIEAPSAPLSEALEEGIKQEIDVGEVHRIFQLGDIKAVRFINGLKAAACNGRVSWISFLRYMFSLANARPLTKESRAAVAMARTLFDIYDKERQREVDLHELANGLVVRESVASSDWSCLVLPKSSAKCVSYK